MPTPAPKDVTELLLAWSSGDNAALEVLIPLIHNDLRRLARHYMRQEKPGHTLQTTALVNELYLRVIGQRESNWQNRAHFFAVSAQSMRRILVDMAREKRAQRRGSGSEPLSLDEALVFTASRAAELVALDDALSELAQLDERKSRIVEMRFFGGLSVDETAEVLQVSPETVMREWKRAKAWLCCELGRTGESDA
jgi:RNA polymerase sigma factor (TIGR02999 family)